MIEAIVGKPIIICTNCESLIRYENTDIKTKEVVKYWAYGCEESYATIKYIKCPICNKDIIIK
jgi:hypothetical protein